MKRLLYCTMVLTMIGPATAPAAEPVDNSATTKKVPSEVITLYEDLYITTSTEVEV